MSIVVENCIFQQHSQLLLMNMGSNIQLMSLMFYAKATGMNGNQTLNNVKWHNKGAPADVPKAHAAERQRYE